MNFKGIWDYTSRALSFAAMIGGLWAIFRLLFLLLRPARGKKFCWKKELIAMAEVVYFAAVTEIIALRGGPGRTRELRKHLFESTLAEFRLGLWSGLYHTLGNLAWFLPMGAVIARRFPRARWYQALLCGALFSAALEAGQYLLRTGITDVDDVFLNALGAGAGFALWKGIRRFQCFTKKR